MTTKAPHFLLYSESTSTSEAARSQNRAGVSGDGAESARCWHFILRFPDGSTRLDVADEEADASDERLELLAVVRGLEALDQPSAVTLVTSSNSIRRGLRFGLDTWRDNQWQWERFGRMTPIKNADLWQRVDRALRFHQVDCRMIRFDRPADDLTRPVPKSLFHGPPPAMSSDPARRPVEPEPLCFWGGSPLTGALTSLLLKWACSRFGGRRWRSAAADPRGAARMAMAAGGPFGAAAHPPHLNLISRAVRRLFGWCGLCRSRGTLVITAH